MSDLTPEPGSRRAVLTEELDALLSEITSLETNHGGDRTAWTDGVAHRVDSLRAAIANREAQLQKLTERAEKIEHIRRVAQDPANREAGAGGGAYAETPVRTRSRGTEHDRAARIIDDNHRAGDITDGVAE